MPAGGEQHGAWFDTVAADAACAFFPEHLVFTEGEFAGLPFVLSDWERLFVRTVFGWKRADGTRLIRVAYLEIAKKNGKTEFAAGLAILLLVGDGEIRGQVYSLATNTEQASIVFEKAGVMVAFSPSLGECVEVFKTSLYCPDLMASFKPLSSAPTGKHGFSVSAAIGDETHEWTDDRLQDAVHKNTAARRQPLEIYITTAGVRGVGYGWQLHSRAVKVLEGAIVDPTFLAMIFAADAEDDWTLEATWRKANPGLGISPKLDFIQEECAKAQESPRLENEFKRYHLNLWTEQVTRWLPMAKWRLCSRAANDNDLWKRLAEELVGRKCWGGLDLASTRDFNALVWAFPPEDLDDPSALLTLLWRFWLPEERLKARGEEEVEFKDWRLAGAITETPGNVTDYRAIMRQVEQDATDFDVQELAIDRWNSTQTTVDLRELGINAFQMGQGYASMSGPSKEYEKLVLGTRLEHGNQPVATWMASNVAIINDPAGNIKPAKDKSTENIDGQVAAIMAVGRAMLREEPEDRPTEVPDDYEVAVA